MFAQRSNIIKPKFITMVYNILKFNKKSKIDLEHMGPEITLEKYLFNNRFNKNFINNYIIPMGAAIWSTSPEMMLQMPRIPFNSSSLAFLNVSLIDPFLYVFFKITDS